MKKFACVFMGILLSAGIFVFAACGNGSGGSPGGGAVQGLPEGTQETGKEPADSPLAVLDNIETDKTFGDAEESGWSFALTAAGTSDYSYDFKWTSHISGREKFYSALALGMSVDDTFGMRSAGSGELGVELFGGGNAGLNFTYVGPESDSEPIVKSYGADFTHDGDLILYTGGDGTERQTSVGELAQTADDYSDETLRHIIAAVRTIPDNVKNGLSLRLAVEKLIDLGFGFTIDDSDGLKITLVAERAFFTELINDMLFEFLPEDWLPYIPRADFGYRTTDFAITLALDQNGLFREYSVSCNLSLELSLDVPDLFKCESGFAFESAFSLSADNG